VTPPAWLTTWLQNLLKPLIEDAVDRAAADLLADVKAEIAAGNQDILGAVSGLGTTVGGIVDGIAATETSVVQQVVNGIKALLPFSL
jgi:hypothetical protein